MKTYFRYVAFTGMDKGTNGIVFETKEDALKSADDLMSRWTLMTGFEIEEVTQEQVDRQKLSVRPAILKGPNHRVQL
tara:strand:- start:57 stop:287 length:231 start_codon:yes stop_codon:yes gene_type:complete